MKVIIQGIFNKEERFIDFDFTGRGSCDDCWDWIENQISDKNNNKKLKS